LADVTSLQKILISDIIAGKIHSKHARIREFSGSALEFEVSDMIEIQSEMTSGSKSSFAVKKKYCGRQL
jgi:hypothetical protein